MNDKNESEADADVEKKSEAIDVEKQPDVVNAEDAAEAAIDQLLEDVFGKDSDECDSQAAKYVYGFCWEKMLAWRVEAKGNGKKTKERKQWSLPPKEPEDDSKMASMVAMWKDGDTYVIPDYLVEDARKKEALKADSCKTSDNNVMYEVHSVTNIAYKLHWKKDKTMLLAISAGKHQKCQVPLNWFEESDKGKEMCVK
eukprot:9533173-Karenia_brevis.AAC.1